MQKPVARRRVAAAPPAAVPPSLSGVRVPHRSFAANENRWNTIADVLAGTDAVKGGGVAYLPSMNKRSTPKEVLLSYQERAMFVNFTERTLQAMLGAIFRKEGGYKVPAKYDPRLSNLNNQGDQLYNFAKKVCREVIGFGRCGILIDMPSQETKEDPYYRLPYMATHDARSIINWRTRLVSGVPVLDQVILIEDHEEFLDFGSTFNRVYRVLDLDHNGYYRVRLIRNQGDKWDQVDEIYPTDFRRRNLTKIPFVFIGPNDLSPNVSKSPISDLVDVNLSHYQTSADLEQARYYTSQPLPVIMGMSKEEADENYSDLFIGSGFAWFFPSTVTSVSMLEYKGDGLGSLERAMVEKERQMALLGARLLSDPKRSAEAAETVRLRNVAETSTLAGIARTVSDGIRSAMQISCDWVGIDTKDDPIEFELNQDFVDATMEPQMLAQLIGAWQAGAIPLADLFWNLQRGEIVRPGSSQDSFMNELDIESPHLSRSTFRLLDSIPEADSIPEPAKAGGR